MNSRYTAIRQAAAFGLAAVVTLSMLASVNLLATQPALEVQMAKQAAPTKVVVTEARRDGQT